MEGKRSAANPYDENKARLKQATKHKRRINPDLIFMGYTFQTSLLLHFNQLLHQIPKMRNGPLDRLR